MFLSRLLLATIVFATITTITKASDSSNSEPPNTRRSVTRTDLRLATTKSFILSVVGNSTLAEALSYGSNVVSLVVFSDAILSTETPILIRYTLLVATAVWHIESACHPTALSFLGTREVVPSHFCDPQQRALITGLIAHRILLQEFPEEAIRFSILMNIFKAPVSDLSNTDVSKPVGWANVQARRLRKFFDNDGWNALGDLSSDVNRIPFSDPTGYQPVNHGYSRPFQLIKPLRWTPLRVDGDNRGRLFHQMHVTPHIARTVTPLVISQTEYESRKLRSPYFRPNRKRFLHPRDRVMILGHLEELLRLQRNLTRDQLIQAYWWDSKGFSVGRFVQRYREMLKFDLFTTYRLALGEVLSLHDATLAAWRAKREHDLVRPTTMMRRLRRGNRARAYVRSSGRVEEINLSEWDTAVPTQPHSEFPSGSAAMCKAGLTHMKLALQDYVGPNGTVPKFDLVLPQDYYEREGFMPDGTRPRVRFENFDEAIETCGTSRLWAGVHFPPSVPAGYKVGEGIGEAAFQHVKDLTNGKVPKNCARCGKY